jgi:c-di-AMP phosphodiesterase-like protein
VVGYIAVDNYSDVQMSVSDEAKFGDMASRLAAMIQEFSVTYKAMLRKLRDDRYFFITTQENFENLERDKFPIVDEVRNAFPNGFTLSLGISYNLDDYSKLGELASSAIDVALSRGGDQTVISPFRPGPGLYRRQERDETGPQQGQDAHHFQLLPHDSQTLSQGPDHGP